MVSNEKGFFTLAGITSFGLDCNSRSEVFQNQRKELDYEDYAETEAKIYGNETVYGIYTNVANFVEWIKANSDYKGCENSKL